MAGAFLRGLVTLGLVLPSLSGCQFKGPSGAPAPTHPESANGSTAVVAAPARVSHYDVPTSAASPPGRQLTYRDRVWSQGPYGPHRPLLIPHDAQGKAITGNAYKLQDVDAPCPPELPAPVATTFTYVEQTNDGPLTCQASENNYYYYLNESEADGLLSYELWGHAESSDSCSGDVIVRDALQSASICAVSSPSLAPMSPSPSSTTTPPPASPPPSPPPSATPPPTPSPPPPSPSPTADCSQPRLEAVHCAISPDGDGIEENTDLIVSACGNWKIQVTGPGLAHPGLLTSGKGNWTVPAWAGTLADGRHLGNGKYTLTLHDNRSGMDYSIPVVITAYHLGQPSLDVFSPNGDGTKDMVTLPIQTASGAGWTLWVDVNGTSKAIDSRTGAMDYHWDGTVNNKILKDGRYSLHLVAQGASLESSDPTVTIAIDTRAPDITAVKVTNVEAALDDTQITYTFQLVADEEATSPVISGIASNSAEIRSSNVAFEKFGESKSTGVSIYETQAKFEPIEIDTLKFVVQISDNVGNTAIKSGTLSGELETVGLAVETADNCALDSHQYSVLDTGDLPATIDPDSTMAITNWRDGGFGAVTGLEMYTAFQQFCLAPLAVTSKNKPFFYVGSHSNKKLEYFVGLKTVLDTEAPLATLPTKITIKRNNEIWFDKTIIVHGISPFGASSVMWDGRNPKDGKPAPQGIYAVAVEYGPDEGITIPLPKRRGVPGLRPHVKLPPMKNRGFIQGIRVINNEDGQSWGPATPGNKAEVEAAFRRFKTNIGPAGVPVPGHNRTSHQWHHIVEKNQPAFGVGVLDSTHNIVRVSDDIHNQIIDLYQHPHNGNDYKTGNLSVRQWLIQVHGNDFNYQYDIGLAALKERGWDFATQGD